MSDELGTLIIFHLKRSKDVDYNEAVELMIAAESEEAALAYAEKAPGPQPPSVWYHPSTDKLHVGVGYAVTDPGIFLVKYYD